jgi:hypothetical protein
VWAVLPPLAVCMFEKIAFNSVHLASFIGYRFIGWYTRGFVLPPKGSPPIEPLAALAPARFLATPGLWMGILVAALFLAMAVRLRRRREPL